MTDQFATIYEFTLPDGNRERFDISMDTQTMEIIRPRVGGQWPSWTRLEFEQCPHCPFSPDTHPECPVALNLVAVIARFDYLMSFERLDASVISDNRHVALEVTAQEGISSLIGLLIAGSSCPFTHFFKPMARFHLPFANRDETMWQATATFLLAKYFTPQGLQKVDMTLKGLTRIYNDVAVLNNAIAQRIRAAVSRVSAENALVHLDVFAKFFTPPLEDALTELKTVFEPFLVTLR